MRRGITPVISTVFLITILIFATGVLYQYVEDLATQNLDVPFLSEFDSEISVDNAFKGDQERINLIISNQGERAINFTEGIQVKIDEVDIDAYSSINEDIDQDIENSCYELELEPGESQTCDTGLDYPSPFEGSKRVSFELADSHKSWTVECSPDSTSDITC